ncbi:MAG: hypothetical protein LBP23_10280 [Treponema sp.]|nr:hypothetical protein [Treponema sp.]
MYAGCQHFRAFRGVQDNENSMAAMQADLEANSAEKAVQNASVRMDELLRQADAGDIYENSIPAKTPTIGILRPAGLYLAPNEQWILDMVRGAMNSNFRKFAAGRITVMNIADEQVLQEEIIRSLSGPGDELDLTARVAARSIMTGNVIKMQGTTRFTVEFTVTDTESHAVLATYSRNHSDIELTEGIALNRAAESLLRDLDVRLNEAGKQALYGASNEADTALAKGLMAMKSGQGLEAMNYLFNAASYDTTRSAASGNLAEVQALNETGLGAGAIVTDFFERQELWQSRLTEYNEFYRTHPPFELYYTPPVPTNMRGSGEARTYDLQFKIGLRWNQTQIEVMEKVLTEYILDGLYKNSREDIDRWELRDLPWDSELFGGPGNLVYNLTVNVENERGEIIVSGPLELHGSLYWYDNRIYADCVQEIDAAFPGIKYIKDQITPQLYIRISGINGVNIETLGGNGFMRVIQTQNGSLPQAQSVNLPKEFAAQKKKELALAADREQKTAREEAKRQKEAAKQAARDRRREEAARNPLRSARIGAGVQGGPVLGSSAWTVATGVEIGIKAWALEGGVTFYPGIHLDHLKTETNFLGVSATPDPFALSFTLGLNYAFFGTRWFASFGLGAAFFLVSDKSSSSSYSGNSSRLDFFVPPYFQARIDWRLTRMLYLRLGYHLELYEADDYTHYFGDEMYGELFDRAFVHNVFAGISLYI